MKPILYIFSGLPGAGKTAIAKEIAKSIKAAYFRLDTVEHGLKEVCAVKAQGEGYRLTYRIVADNLKLGNDVIVDCCNPWELTRNEWEKIAADCDGYYINIEIVCSDRNEHRNRVEKRESDMDGFLQPSWEEIQLRDYHEWKKKRIIIETANKGVSECATELLDKINIEKKKFV